MHSEYTEIRLSHLLRNCSVGAVVRGPDYLMVVEDTRHWKTAEGQVAGNPLHYVDQVRSMLDLNQSLRQPPVAVLGADGLVRGSYIPATRFPGWMKCPACSLLHYKPWRHCPPDELPRCANTQSCTARATLEQVQWVMAHAEGYLAEVPWHRLTHQKKKGSPCRPSFDESFLFLHNLSAGEQSLRCGKCGARARFGTGAHASYGNQWQQPWYRENAPTSEKPAIVLSINDARLHIPETRSALVIPPESRIQHQSVVGRLYASSDRLRRLQAAVRPLHKKVETQRLAAEFNCSTDAIAEALQEIDKGFPLYGNKPSKGNLPELEYGALIEPIPDNTDDEDFVTRHHTHAWKSLLGDVTLHPRSRRLIDCVDRLVEVRRLKEILILTGFKRLDGHELTPPDLVGELDWLPALELYGEGLFFTFDIERINRHAENHELRERAKVAAEKIKQHGIAFDQQPPITPQFIFLHTLAHLLIRQLEHNVGYPASSLSERIYSHSGQCQMAGILIYVAVPDVVGSLGGLAEMAQPHRFLPLLSSAFDQARWCSIDPVCSEHVGQGPAQINRAACHACALLPETCCQYGNLLLDRTAINGDIQTDVAEFLDG